MTTSSDDSESLAHYEQDSRLGRDRKILFTVKNTFQIDKNHRQEGQHKKANPEVFGREKTRAFFYGLVGAASLDHDRYSWDLEETEWSCSALEPYAVELLGNHLAMCGANYTNVMNIETGKIQAYEHPWMRLAHSVQFSHDRTRLLVATSGFDVILEYEVANAKLVWEWFAWENGLAQSKLGYHFTRSRAESEALSSKGQQVFLVDDPQKYEMGIATRMCPCHINGAGYDTQGNVLATLFHQ